MDDDAVKNFIPFRVSAEEPLFEVGCIQSVVFGDFIAVRVDPFPTVDAGGDRIVFAMIMQLYPLDADRLVEVGNFYLRIVARASAPSLEAWMSGILPSNSAMRRSIASRFNFTSVPIALNFVSLLCFLRYAALFRIIRPSYRRYLKLAANRLNFICPDRSHS